jgi:hypothetical protein
MNKRKTKKIKRKGGASLRSPQTISELEKLKLLKRDNLYEEIGIGPDGIKKHLDTLKENLIGIPDIGQRVVDSKVEYDKSIRTPATNVKNNNKSDETPEQKLTKSRENNKYYMEHVLKSARLAQNITNHLYKLYSYRLSPEILHIPV